ncbi:hypothetical protein AVEN_149385-1 [Araneus ventricosus]|uniref:Xrn1 N-terminal domain-containing protein n=1 Tax=Araneus ventricosus TaxID=182803 RepID=A0A4Y2MHM7_ARAVE|nr:hypothetical protein AVEN_149385-1 [Araneus ventricosus]
MGITNFCTLINKTIEPDQEPPKEPEYFDSILYDVQSLLHVAISEALETNEPKLFRELCESAWKTFQKHLNIFLSYAAADRITLILCFDGIGVPMKWPTQRERRSKKDGIVRSVQIQGKSKYRSALFGPNIIALEVQKFFVTRLKKFRFQNIQELVVIISGCNVPGEGEHKLFHIAEKMQSDPSSVSCRNPLIVSQDQDVFIIALMRLSRYETLQIFRYGNYYPVTKLFREWLSYPIYHLEVCSFLFGNDFIPTLVGITPNNACAINQCLELQEHSSSAASSCCSDDTLSEEEESLLSTHPVSIIACFIERMSKNLRFQKLAHLDGSLVESFWIVFFWLKDYYTQSEFPQKYIENPIYDAFDRNQLLTALTSPQFSFRCYERARIAYQTMRRDPVSMEEAEKAVFMEEDVVKILKPYWVAPNDKACVVLKIKNQSPPSCLVKFPKSTSTGIGRW